MEEKWSKILSELSFFGDKGIEYEIRFRYFDSRLVNSREYIPLLIFQRLKDIYNLNHSTLDENIWRRRDSDKRWIQSSNGQIITEKKEKLEIYDIEEYGLRLAISRETLLDVEDVPKDFVKSRRVRWSTEGWPRLDLTEIHDDKGIYYSVELEFSSRRELQLLGLQKIREVWSNLHGSNMIFDFAERKSVWDFVTSNIADKMGLMDNISNTRPLPVRMHMKPRNLQWDDLQYGGLVGNPKTPYAVSHKADGRTQWLVAFKKNLYLTFPPYWFVKVGHIEDKAHFIAEGELIESNEASEFWLYDCLYYLNRGNSLRNDNMTKLIQLASETLDSSIDIKNVERKIYAGRPGNLLLDLPFDIRHYILDILKMIVNGSTREQDLIDLTIRIKKFWTILEPNDLFAIITARLNEQKSKLIEYPTDGLIFMPTLAAYSTVSEEYPLSYYEAINKKKLRGKILTAEEENEVSSSYRSLVNMPDICKWKPIERMTIDLLYRQSNLYASGLRGKVDVLWSPDDKYKLILPPDLPDNTIVELGLQQANSDTFVVQSIRRDKFKPNRIDRVKDNMRHIRNPISEDVITGNSLQLMRHYHNRVKRLLYQQALRNTINKEQRILLSIGAGQGGEINKWDEYDIILAIEPDSKHINELIKRARARWGESYATKLRILQAYGQNLKSIQEFIQLNIGQSKVDTISCMFTLTFFWDSPRSVEGLAWLVDNYLAKDGSFIFLSLDGQKIEEYFDSPLSGVTRNKLSSFNDNEELLFSIEWKTTDKRPFLVVTIPNTILEKDKNESQIEFPPRLDDLWKYLFSSGLSFQSLFDLQNEGLLSSSETALSRFYVGGALQRKEEKKYPFEIKINNFNPIDYSVYLKRESTKVPNLNMALNFSELQPIGGLQRTTRLFNVVRMGTRRSGNSLLNSFLLATNKRYQDNERRYAEGMNAVVQESRAGRKAEALAMRDRLQSDFEAATVMFSERSEQQFSQRKSQYNVSPSTYQDVDILSEMVNLRIVVFRSSNQSGKYLEMVHRHLPPNATKFMFLHLTEQDGRPKYEVLGVWFHPENYEPVKRQLLTSPPNYVLTLFDSEYKEEARAITRL